VEKVSPSVVATLEPESPPEKYPSNGDGNVNTNNNPFIVFIPAAETPLNVFRLAYPTPSQVLISFAILYCG
jgi:hypothetical protein